MVATAQRFVDSREALADVVAHHLDQDWPTPPLVAIDGRSGAGKSTLTATLLERFALGHLALDDLYDGWAGLAAGANLARRALRQRMLGAGARLPRYDWERSGYFEVFAVPDGALLLDGCGSGYASLDSQASLRIWVECPDQVRATRVLQRDGVQHEEDHRQWAEAEASFFDDHGSALAHVVYSASANHADLSE